MIRINVSGRLGNQIFHLALAILLMNSGHKVKLFGAHLRLNKVFKTYNTNYRSLKLNSFNSNLHLIKINVVKMSNILPVKIKNLLKLVSFRFIDRKDSNFIKNNSSFGPSISPNYKEMQLLNGTYSEEFIMRKFKKVTKISLDKSKNYVIQGYWQYFDLAKYSKNHLLNMINNEQKSRILIKYKSLFEHDYTKSGVAVHVRGGDYIKLSEFNIITESYYSKAISIMAKKVCAPKFYFFYDDLGQLKKLIPFIPNNSVLVSESTKNEVDDFLLMMNFKHFIIANSTFSWWASFLSSQKNKIIIRPKKFFMNKEDYLHNKDMIEIQN
jgi:hypothetical protein